MKWLKRCNFVRVILHKLPKSHDTWVSPAWLHDPALGSAHRRTRVTVQSSLLPPFMEAV